MKEQELDKKIYAKITALAEQADSLLQDDEFDLAIERYEKALALLPKPARDWEAATWLLASIGECYFLLGYDDQALEKFQDAYNCPGAAENPLIHLRLGELYYDLEHTERAKDHLTRAYMLEGDDIFQDEDPKYAHFIKSFLR